MADELIERGDQGDGVVVSLNSGSVVSMQAMQQIYSELTGRSESLDRTYRINHAVSYEDLNQLNAKIEQLYEQYHIVSKNCSVTLYHLDDQKQTFSSFDRFKMYDRTTLSPVENVRLEYNFLILLPLIKKPQSYTVEINIHSRAAMIKRAKADPGFRAEMFYELVSSNTAHVSINYIDYTVARNFQVAINGWFKALPEVDSSRLLGPLRNLRNHFVFLFRFGSLTAYLCASYLQLSPLLINNSKLSALFTALTILFGGLCVLYVLAGELGSIATDAVRRLQCKSYLSLTRGDELCAQELVKTNMGAWIKGVGALFCAVFANLASNWIGTLIGLPAI